MGPLVSCRVLNESTTPKASIPFSGQNAITAGATLSRGCGTSSRRRALASSPQRSSEPVYFFGGLDYSVVNRVTLWSVARIVIRVLERCPLIHHFLVGKVGLLPHLGSTSSHQSSHRFISFVRPDGSAPLSKPISGTRDVQPILIHSQCDEWVYMGTVPVIVVRCINALAGNHNRGLNGAVPSNCLKGELQSP